jgi:methionine synthase II (cobalamin-independent)
MVAVLGLLITTQHPLEDAGAVEARMGEAPQDVPLPRLAVSPQWGFASREAENPLTPAAQEAKRRLVAQVAPRGWQR